jgi:hypothetical protein
MLIDKCTSEKHLSLNTTAVSCVFFCIFFFFSLSLSKIFVPNIKRCCIYLQMRPFCHERVGGAFIGPIATSRLSTLAINSEVCGSSMEWFVDIFRFLHSSCKYWYVFGAAMAFIMECFAFCIQAYGQMNLEEYSIRKHRRSFKDVRIEVQICLF